jgi:arylsulfatase A-like enzyme
MRNALVLIIDRLGSAYLGPYGNTWIETPAWNRLAARSMLFESALVDSPDLDTVYHSYWQGRHALSARHTCDVPPLVEQLDEQGVTSWLVTDEPAVARHAAAAGFHERVILPAGGARESPDFEQTQLARVFATAIDVLDQATAPFLVWVHAQGMQGPWDAPYAYRHQFAEDEDPDPPAFTNPPDCRLAEDYDPDQLLGFLHAYAGQVALLDTCLDVLLDAFWQNPLAESTSLLATSTRGYPLGEHQYVGRTEAPLQAELLQVPWMIHWPADAGALLRSHLLVQPPDLYPTLLEWFHVPLPTPPIWGRALSPSQWNNLADEARRQACAMHEEQRALRTPAWFLRHGPNQPPSLYVKPDDRWECNEVASRCEDVVNELLQTLDDFANAARDDQRAALRPLSAGLLEGNE